MWHPLGLFHYTGQPPQPVFSLLFYLLFSYITWCMLLICCFFLSLVLGELAYPFSFWPAPTTIWSLSLSSSMYALVGVTTQLLRGRLTKRAVWEYLGIGAAILTVSFFATSWTG